jgi:GNAT superfamily N-acetyltransferase
LKRFVAFPERLYKGHPYYVPKVFGDETNALRSDRNPAFEYCDARYWMAYRDGVPAGRIAGIISRRYNETWKKNRARFGWLDFADDSDVSAALLGAVEGWARSRGLDEVHGPLGFCDLDREGLLVDGFDELDMLITNYNYPYYAEHLERLGYGKDVDWTEQLITVPAALPPNLDRVAKVALDRAGMHLLQTRSMRDIRPYVDGVFDVINEAYKELYSVVALSNAQMRYYAKSFFSVLDHEWVTIILDKEDRVAAFGVAMPSLSRALQKCRGRLFPFGFVRLLLALRKSDRLDLLLTAARPPYQKKGLNAVLINQIWKVAIRRGIKWAETGPTLETNANIQAQWAIFGPRQHRRRRCYVKAI